MPDLLLALNGGLPGMATVHANSAREALVKLCPLPLLAGENISTLSGFGLADWPLSREGRGQDRRTRDQQLSPHSCSGRS